MTPRGLKVYATLLTITTTVLLALSVHLLPFQDEQLSFEEIDVERINVVEPDGTLKLVISNSARQAEGTIGGEEVPLERTRPSGMIFFNDYGDEVGGLAFGGDRTEGGMGLMFDQAGQDQVIGVRSLEWTDEEEGRRRQTGLELWDRPKDVTVLECVRMRQELEEINDERERERAEADLAEKCGGASRGFIGRTADGQARLNLRDGSGDVRLRLTVEDDGAASIEFLNSAGDVVRSIQADSHE